MLIGEPFLKVRGVAVFYLKQSPDHLMVPSTVVKELQIVKSIPFSVLERKRYV